jgi:hypothetical protein
MHKVGEKFSFQPDSLLKALKFISLVLRSASLSLARSHSECHSCLSLIEWALSCQSKNNSLASRMQCTFGFSSFTNEAL